MPETPYADTTDWLEVQLLEAPEPLDAQFGVSKRKSAIETLKEHLIGDPLQTTDQSIWGDTTPLPPLKIFALLDAGCDPTVPDILGAADLPHKCLFTGKALTELGDAAPWLVELEPDHALTRRLMTEEAAPGGLWDKQLAFFIRSRDGFDAVWKHLRRFTRIRDETGKWYFFRFWSSPISTRLLALGNHPDVAPLVSAMFPSGRRAISVLATEKTSATFLTRHPGTEPPARGQPLVLTPEIREIMRQIQRDKNFDEIAEVAHRHSAAQTGFAPADSAAILTPLRRKFYDMGFWRRDHIAKLCCWELILGPGFISNYANGAIRSIVQNATAAHVAINGIERFLDAQAEARREELEGKPPAGDTDIWTET